MTHATGADDDEIQFLPPRADVFERSGVFDGVVDVSPARGRPVRWSRGPDVDAVTVEVERSADGEGGAERARSRTVTALAALGATAMIAIGVTAAAPWSSEDERAASSTTVAAQPPAPATTTATSPQPNRRTPSGPRLPVPEVDLSPNGPGWMVVDPPAGMSVVGAYDEGRVPTSDGRLDIWASPGADRLTGTWVSVSAARIGGGIDLVPGGEAVDVDGHPGLATTDVDGVAMLTWHPDPRHRLTLMGSGIDRDQMLAVARAITLERDQIVYSSPPDTVLGVALDQLVHTRRGASELGAEAVELGERIVVYAGATGLDSLLVGTRPVDPGDAAIARFLLASATDRTGAPIERRVDLGGAAAIVGTTPLRPGIAVVQWQHGGEWSTALSTGPADDLIASLRTSRMADPQEWDALVSLGLDPADGIRSDPVFVRAGTGLLDDVSWSASISDDGRFLWIRSDRLFHQEFLTTEASRPVRAYRTTDATFVLALLPTADVGDRTMLQVTPAGPSGPAGSVTAALIALERGGAHVAVVAFDGTGEYEVSFV